MPPRSETISFVCSLTSCSMSRSPVRIVVSNPRPSACPTSVAMASSASNPSCSYSGMLIARTTCFTLGICSRMSSGIRVRVALYSA